MAKVLAVVGNGVEEIEIIVPIDILRRAGATVTVAKVPTDAADAKTLNVKCTMGVIMVAEHLIDEVLAQPWDMILIPGGLGCAEFNKCTKLVERMKLQKKEGKWLAAICAAPVMVFAANGLLEGEKATCFPSLVDKLPDKSQAAEKVVVSGKIVTSQSPSTAMTFSMKLAEVLFGDKQVKDIKSHIGCSC